jgi:hypothetical protein
MIVEYATAAVGIVGVAVLLDRRHLVGRKNAEGSGIDRRSRGSEGQGEAEARSGQSGNHNLAHNPSPLKIFEWPIPCPWREASPCDSLGFSLGFCLIFPAKGVGGPLSR